MGWYRLQISATKKPFAASLRGRSRAEVSLRPHRSALGWVRAAWDAWPTRRLLSCARARERRGNAPADVADGVTEVQALQPLEHLAVHGRGEWQRRSAPHALGVALWCHLSPPSAHMHASATRRCDVCIRSCLQRRTRSHAHCPSLTHCLSHTHPLLSVTLSLAHTLSLSRTLSLSVP